VPTYLQFKVSLRNIEPAIWRRFLLRSDATFAHLHLAIQAACGWQEMHLFRFFEGEPYGAALAGIPDEEGGRVDVKTPDAATVPLSSYFDARTGRKCGYLYDYGDDWIHEVVLEGRLELRESFFRKLLAGERAFPPEDCGGVSGYETCLLARNFSNESDPEFVKWLGRWDPERFDHARAAKEFDRTRLTRRQA